MASSSDIGANFSQYQGDVNLGGGSFGAAKLDTRPIEDLARYTYLYNKSLFDQRQKDADEKIAQMAKLADIHVNDLRDKDREEIIKQLNDTIAYAQEYARKIPSNPREKIEQSLEWQKKTIDLFNNYTSGKARAIKYTKELNDIEADKTLSESTKAEKKKELNDLFQKSKISEQFGGVPDYDLKAITIPTPLTLTADIIQEGDNANVNAKLTGFNYRANSQAAFDILNGINRLYPDQNLPQGQTTEARQQRTIESEAKAFRDSAEVLNSILQSKDASGKLIYYKPDANGNLIFDQVKFENDISPSNTALLGAYTALKNMDADARAKYNQAQQGRLSDKGFNFKLPPNVVPDDYKIGFVDFTKPISPEQIVTAGIFSHYAGDKVEKAVQQTDNDLQRQRLAAEWARIGLEKERIKKASTQAVLGADAVLNEVRDAIKLGQPRRYKEANGKWVDVLDIADPNLLKEFGTIDKDGNMINRPDVIRFDKTKNQLSLVYLQKQTEDDDKGVFKKGDVIQNNGVASVERTVPINPTEWFGQIAARKFSADDRGAINNFVDQIYSAFGRDLTKLAEGYKGGATTTGPETKTTESTQKIKKVTVKGL